MNAKSLTLNVVGVDGFVAPNADGGQLVIHGEHSEGVTVNLTAEALLQMSILMDRLALDLESARYVAGKTTTVRGGASAAPEASVVTRVHLVQELNTLRTADHGCLLDVKALQGGHFRISLQADQTSSLLSALLTTERRRVQ